MSDHLQLRSFESDAANHFAADGLPPMLPLSVAARPVPLDRKVDLAGRYAAAEDTKVRVKISAELRLLEAEFARLLRQIETEPAPSSHRSEMARKAARIRWDRSRA
ncbi:hypothetical protein ACFXG4_47605 [Nocardia sp. NPDC059246]|uniref:hypothetical protein n=1 Tax=unclassified Nocardia TaxID=2637762 RepID=UPI00367DA507